MELTTASNIIIGLLLLIIFFYVVIGSYLIKVRKNLLSEWNFLLLSIRQREDMLPLLIAKMKELKVEFDEDKILAMRWDSEKTSELSAEKNLQEGKLNNLIASFITTVEKHVNLKKDAVLDNQAKELKDFTKILNRKLKSFNKKIQIYNKLSSSFLMIPLHFLSDVKPLPELNFLA